MSVSLQATWRDELRTRIVRRGIQIVCGVVDHVDPKAAQDVSLVSGGFRIAWLRALGALGVTSFVARSGLGHRFLCHIGDLAEYPFYMRRAHEKELAICVAWLRGEDSPVVYDVGANVGFMSTQLAQMLPGKHPRIFAFEPVPTTFGRLVDSVQRLGLADRVHPVQAALSDAPRSVRMTCSRWNSLEAQVLSDGPDGELDGSTIHAAGMTLDGFSAASGVRPDLVKMDIEGCEVAALRGARGLLSGDDRPAILFEYNPVTLAQRGASPAAFGELLPDYALYYVDDLRGQLLPFGSPVSDLGQFSWICNLFAVPRGAAAMARWTAALQEAQHRVERGPSAAAAELTSAA